MAISGAQVTQHGVSGYSQVLYGDFSTKESGGDVIPPEYVSSSIPTAGTSISLVFDEPVTFGAGGNAGVTVNMSGGASVATYSSGDGTDTLVYSLSRTIEAGETGTISYTQPGDGIEDIAGNDLATFSGETVTNNSTADTTVPTLSTAIITGDSTTLRLTFDEAVTFGAGGNTGWAVTLSGGAATLTYASGDSTNQLVYTVSRTVAEGETGTIDYTQPGNGVEDLAGNDLASIVAGALSVSSVSELPDNMMFTIFMASR